MQIVFVGPFGLQPKGTMSGRALPLARALAARGHRITVLIPPWDDPDRAGLTWEEAGVQVVNLPLPSPGLPRLPLLFHLGLTRSLVKQTLARRPEVVHLFKPKAYAGLTHLALWMIRRWRRLPVRLVVDADDWEQAWNEVLPYPALPKKLFAWQERWGWRHADAVTAASQALLTLAVSQLGVDPARLFYVPNAHPALSAATGPPAGAPSPAPRSPATILLYTRFAEFRLERIVGLVAAVAAQAPAARWLIVGRGFQGEEKILESKLNGAGLGSYVDFTGWPVEDVGTCFEAATVAVYPYDDTLLNRTKCSVKLIELMAAGLPVVANAVGQNCEYIRSGVSGLLIPADDDEAMAAAVAGLLKDPARRQRLGRSARRTVQEHYTWPQLVKNVEKAYDEVSPY
jgi:glycosyltransferase involved in cell wall biosynthesis